MANHLDSTILAALDSAAQRAPDPHPWSPKVPRRVRRRQLALTASVALTAIAVCSAGLFATHLIANPASTVASPAGRELGRRVYVTADVAREGPFAEIVALDPTSRAPILHRYPTGYDPALAVAPDGSAIYTLSREGDAGAARDVLRSIDPDTGRVTASVEVPDRWGNTGRALFPTIAVSPEGTRLYILQVRGVNADDQEFFIGTVDLSREEMLPNQAELGSCGAAALLPVNGGMIHAVCHDSHDVHLLEISPDGSATRSSVVPVPTRADERTDDFGNNLQLWRMAWAALSPDETRVYIATQNGRVFILDTATASIEEEVRLPLGEDVAIPFGKIALSPDGEAMYVGVGRLDDSSRLAANQLAGFDTQSWRQFGRIDFPDPLWSVSLSADGSAIYALSSEAEKLFIVNPQDLRIQRTIRDVGNSPESVAVPGPGG